MINRIALDKLEQLISSPTIENRTNLLSIPALYKVISTEGDLHRFLPILRWLARSTRDTLTALLVEAPLPEVSGSLEDPGDWMQVCCPVRMLMSLLSLTSLSLDWLLIQHAANTHPPPLSKASNGSAARQVG